MGNFGEFVKATQVKRERLELHQKLEQVGLARDVSSMKLDLASVLDKKGGQSSPD